MSQNRMFLICAHHQEIESSLCIGERQADFYECSPVLYLDDGRTTDEWFKKHLSCGKGDHFRLAYQYPRDHDADKPKVAEAVKGMINGSH